MQRINPIMSRDVVHDAVDVMVRKMASAQMRRMPVVSRDLRLIGMVSIGDVATRCDVSERDAIGETLDHVSQPRRYPLPLTNSQRKSP